MLHLPSLNLKKRIMTHFTNKASKDCVAVVQRKKRKIKHTKLIHISLVYTYLIILVKTKENFNLLHNNIYNRNNQCNTEYSPYIIQIFIVSKPYT